MIFNDSLPKVLLRISQMIQRSRRQPTRSINIVATHLGCLGWECTDPRVGKQPISSYRYCRCVLQRYSSHVLKILTKCTHLRILCSHMGQDPLRTTQNLQPTGARKPQPLNPWQDPPSEVEMRCLTRPWWLELLRFSFFWWGCSGVIENFGALLCFLLNYSGRGGFYTLQAFGSPSEVKWIVTSVKFKKHIESHIPPFYETFYTFYIYQTCQPFWPSFLPFQKVGKWTDPVATDQAFLSFQGGRSTSMARGLKLDHGMFLSDVWPTFGVEDDTIV